MHFRAYPYVSFYGFSYYKGTGSHTYVFLEFLEFGAQEG